MRFGAYNADDRLYCNYSIDDKLFNSVASHRDLGVLIDCKLHIHEYVSNVVQ